MSTIASRMIGLICLLVRLTQVSSHGTEVRYCKTNSQKLRIFVAHWHEGEVEEPSDAGTMNIRNDNTNEVFELTPNGIINNHDKSNLTDVGDCQGVETFVATTCPFINDDDDWAYFDFDVSCENPPQYSLLAGNTIILTEGCTDLYPASISLSTACEVTNSPSLSASPSVTSPTKSPSPSTSFPTNKPSLKPSSRPSRDPSSMVSESCSYSQLNWKEVIFNILFTLFSKISLFKIQYPIHLLRQLSLYQRVHRSLQLLRILLEILQFAKIQGVYLYANQIWILM